MPGKLSPAHQPMIERLLEDDGALLALSGLLLVPDLCKAFGVGRSAAWTALERAREVHAQRVQSAE